MGFIDYHYNPIILFYFLRKIRRAAKRVPKRDRISTVSQYDIDKLNKKRFVFMSVDIEYHFDYSLNRIRVEFC